MDWDAFKGGLIVGAIGGTVGGLFVFIAVLLKKPVHCPQCNEKLPKFRAPISGNEALKGGWICKKCGCKVDKNGKKVEG